MLAPLIRDGQRELRRRGVPRERERRGARARRRARSWSRRSRRRCSRSPGREADGTITWMTGPKTLREHTVPRIREAAATAGRPAPRVVVGLPIAVTDARSRRRATSAARGFQVYGMLPSYRAMLDREGAEGPADVAIVGDESAVGAALDVSPRPAPPTSSPFRSRSRATPTPCERTRDLLVRVARGTLSSRSGRPAESGRRRCAPNGTVAGWPHVAVSARTPGGCPCACRPDPWSPSSLWL